MVEDLVTIPEAAEIAGVHDRTVRRWIAAGRLATYQSQIGLKKFVRRSQVEELKEPVPVSPEPEQRRRRRK